MQIIKIELLGLIFTIATKKRAYKKPSQTQLK